AAVRVFPERIGILSVPSPGTSARAQAFKARFWYGRSPFSSFQMISRFWCQRRRLSKILYSTPKLLRVFVTSYTSPDGIETPFFLLNFSKCSRPSHWCFLKAL